ncbi:LuxR C-terminal-related transcriptional regulator [Frigoribacterium sp. CFBP9039]|uniref:LuxR C-terminal-related transcriptional regulator n=1 Tax=Frigoribacterium sp. CFBP9029 TaxID=3096541 RepID=UPI002A6A9E8E|nr:LuxR C-terminal-related transcriptional regulator [Frigoribacterium sp. CFBP9039]MDY0946169.1 LuxR C-terminal-related transcriptional regulator [Frigoribacterium sp. CFBP9039]
MNTPDDTAADYPSAEMQPADHRAALDAIERAWTSIAPLQGARLREAIRSTPEDEWRGRPRILLALAASHRSVGSRSRSAALPWFRGVAKAIDADPTMSLEVRAGYHIHLAAALRSLGNLVVAHEHLEVARTLIENDTTESISTRISLSASFSLQLGLIRVHYGEYDQAQFALGLAGGLAVEHLSLAERVECLSALAYVAMLLGDFRLADEHLEAAEALAEGTELMSSVFAALAQITRLQLALERGEPGVAAPVESVRLATRGSDWEAHGWFAEAHACLVERRYIEVLDLLARITRLVDAFTGTSTLPAAIASLRSETMRCLGQPQEARRLAAPLVPTPRHIQCPARVLALVHLAAGEPEAALDALEPCLVLGDLHSDRTMPHVHAIVAAAHLALGETARADIAFDRSLLAAGRNESVWMFSTLGDDVLRHLLERASHREQSQPIRASLERLLGSSVDATPRLDEPLSDRELVIVRHLATGQTLGQIGSQLFISVNTVKSHVRSIYRKLQASSRREAMTRVRELGLHIDD